MPRCSMTPTHVERAWSKLTPMASNPRLLYLACTGIKTGISCSHLWHHDAQNITKVYLLALAVSIRFTVPPSHLFMVKFGGVLPI